MCIQIWGSRDTDGHFSEHFPVTNRYWGAHSNEQKCHEEGLDFHRHSATTKHKLYVHSTGVKIIGFRGLSSNGMVRIEMIYDKFTCVQIPKE